MTPELDVIGQARQLSQTVIDWCEANAESAGEGVIYKLMNRVNKIDELTGKIEEGGGILAEPEKVIELTAVVAELAAEANHHPRGV